MPDGHPLRSGTHAHVPNVLQLRRQDHLPDHEVHAHHAHDHAECQEQHRHDAFHLEDDALHGHERLQDVHGENDGHLLQAMRNENGRLFRSLLHLNL